MGQTPNRRAQIGFNLSIAVFLGASARAGAAEQIAEKSSRRTDASFAPRSRGKNNRRRVAGAFSNPATQNHLAAGTARRLIVMKTKQVLDLLRTYESRNVLFIEPDGSWPIVWERAKDVSVWDTDGKKYLDLSGAFGVAAAGHANTNVVKAGQKQMARLLHAMGDVHPPARKAELARELSRLTFERWTRSAGKTIFCNSGFEAVEV